jgi:hypothetical protein
VQGMDEEDLERLLQLHLHIVSVFFNVLINICWAYFLLDYVYLHMLIYYR